jgi:hypothetical protein
MAASDMKLSTSAVRAAAKDVADEQDKDAPAKARSGGVRNLVLGLILLDVLGIGGFLYLRYERNGEKEKAISRARAQIKNLKTQLVFIDDMARRIERDKVQQVDDPGVLMQTVAQSGFKLSGNLVTAKGMTSRFGKTNYDETVVRFHFNERQSLDFDGMLGFFIAVENANPSVQFTEIDFGDRRPGVGSNMWEIKSGSVRVLPKSG